MKEIKSITIDKNILAKIEEQAKNENRNFSNMVEQMAIYYLDSLKNEDAKSK